MQQPTKEPTWKRTRIQNLVRHKGGKYYGRFWINGKEVWKALKTSHFSIAETRLAEHKKELKRVLKAPVDTANANMTFGEAVELKKANIAANVAIKRRTRTYWDQTFIALEKSWPGLLETELRKVTPSACQEWAGRYSKSICATRYNGALTTLRHTLEMGIEHGIILSNPAANLKRMRVRAKRLELPTRDQFTAFIAEMSAGGGRDSRNCADLAQGLAYSGCRLGEAAALEWRDIDFVTGEITVRGDAAEGTKNWEIRRVPMIPEARQLFERMHKDRAGETGVEHVFRVRDCEKSMTRAAKKIGMVRITHHDLRHFFATVCIESGVDIPTVSRWLGHKDGGALAMKTYGHLRREHSVAQAQKVSFASLADTSAAAPSSPSASDGDVVPPMEIDTLTD